MASKIINDKTFFEYAFQFIILTQPALWITLYHSKIQFQEQFKIGFYALAVSAIFGIKAFYVKVGFYTETIMIQYVILTVVSFYLYNQRHNIKEAVCLAFLTVFLNSIYWELPLHVVELMQYGFYPAQLVQFWRLFPLLFFFDIKQFNRDSLLLLSVGTVFSIVMISFKIGYPHSPFSAQVVYMVTRFVCTIILTKTIIEAPNNDTSPTD